MTRIHHTLRSAIDYRDGLAFVMAGHAGMGTEVPDAAQGALVSWNYFDIEQDRAGTFSLAHEIGHLLWLDEAYAGTRIATDSAGSFSTRSREGYERNIMAHHQADIARRPRRGRPWVSWRQAREMAVLAYRADDRPCWPRETMRLSRRTTPDFFVTRYPKRIGR